MVVQHRDRLLFEELQRVQVVTAVQAAALAGFSSKTRVNARLLRLTKAGYVRRSIIGTVAGGRAAVYRLPDRTTLRGERNGHLEHALGITDVYVSLRTWETRAGVRLKRFERGTRSLLPPGVRLIPDAYLEVSAPSGTRAYFLEVDRGTEALPVWLQKAEAYLALARSGAVETILGHTSFSVLVVAYSERRTLGICSAVQKATEKLFYFADQESLKSDGPYAPLWLRPGGELRVPLM